MTHPTKIFLRRNFFSNTFTCKGDREKAYDLVSSRQDQSAADNKIERGRQQGRDRLLNTQIAPYSTAVAIRTYVSACARSNISPF